MKIVAVVQARVASSRLPAKVLLNLGGKTALEQCLLRVSRFERVAEVVVATPDTPADEPLISVARRLGYRVQQGSENDVLSRFVLAAQETKADVVVRCTSDCPLLDPTVSSYVIECFVSAPGRVDYAANFLERRLPRGLDTEVIAREALERAHRDATTPDEREHVTPHLYRRPEQFKLLSAIPEFSADLSHHRWTLDTLDDYRFLHAVFERLGPDASRAAMTDVLAILEREPELSTINAHVAQKAVQAGGG